MNTIVVGNCIGMSGYELGDIQNKPRRRTNRSFKPHSGFVYLYIYIYKPHLFQVNLYCM